MTKPNDSNTLVTVYIPTYNRSELLKRAVESVLNQDYRNIELIVVDDNSTDETHNYLARVSKEDSRLKYFINEKNSGACVSRNKAISSASGEFITGLDDDDYFMPHHVSSLLVSWIKLEDKYIALYPNSYIKRHVGLSKLKQRIPFCSRKDIIVANHIGNQLFTRTKYLKEAGGFDENLPAWQDLECWYRLLKFYNSKAACTNIYSYIHDTSHPHERITTGKVDSIFFAYNYMVSKHKLSKTEAEILKLQLVYYTKEDPEISSFLKSIIYRPKRYNFFITSRKILGLFKRKIMN